MSHKLDSILESVGCQNASFVKASNGEKWGHVDPFKHELGESVSVIETDEDGSFLQFTLTHNEFTEEEVTAKILHVTNCMNGIQNELTFMRNPSNGKLHAKRHFITTGMHEKYIQEMVNDRYVKMKDIFEDCIWLCGWKIKNEGTDKEMFEALFEREHTREKRKNRRTGNQDFDPAYA